MANPNPVPPPEHSRWQPGKSPNPGGKPAGARNRLTGAFLHDLADVYAEKGKKAIEKLCEDDPRSFVRAIVSLCPKQIEAAGPLDGLEDGTLQGFLQLFQLYTETRRAQAAGLLNGSVEPSSTDGAAESGAADRTAQ
jgi:hypothetical protein